MVKVRIGAVVSEFNYDITHMMLELAKEHAKFLDSEITKVIAVPGVFDMPLAIKNLLEQDEIDAVVTIGAVIEGATAHDEIVIQHASRKITDLSLDYNKPVALGICGPKMTRLEAHQRIDFGKHAVEAVVKMVETPVGFNKFSINFFLFSEFFFDSSIKTIHDLFLKIIFLF